MYIVESIELDRVREALKEDPWNLGVGILHVPTGRIALRPFDQLKNRGGHLELVHELEWVLGECLGFIVARPAAECVMVNLSQLNAQAGALWMAPETFRNIVLALRQSWAGMAARGSPG
jgi:hypothetical protein